MSECITDQIEHFENSCCHLGNEQKTGGGGGGGGAGGAFVYFGHVSRLKIFCIF